MVTLALFVSFFCTPRRKEKRNVSADSVGSIAPLLKYKRSGGFFKMTSSNKSSKQGKHSSCLNSKVFKGMMLSRKTADSIHPTVGGGAAGGGASSLGVSRVRIFNANSEQYEAATGRHTVQVPAPAPTNEVPAIRYKMKRFHNYIAESLAIKCVFFPFSLF